MLKQLLGKTKATKQDCGTKEGTVKPYPLALGGVGELEGLSLK